MFAALLIQTLILLLLMPVAVAPVAVAPVAVAPVAVAPVAVAPVAVAPVAVAWMRQRPLIASKRVGLSRLTITSTPTIPVNGGPVLFQAKSSGILKALTGKFLGHQVFFNFDASTDAWYGFGGIRMEAASGHYKMMLEATMLDGNRFTYNYPITIGRARYRRITLNVPRQFTEFDEEAEARIREERELKTEVFNRLTPERLWSGVFAAPVDTIVTDPFGTRRSFNGKVRSAHYGLDFEADEGTPVAAMNNGTVVLAREMFYEGGFVAIDHGQGLLTLYMHLSKINVREGDFVPKMQIIALSGGSGRATRPHLHVGIRWQGLYVDPATFMKFDLP